MRYNNGNINEKKCPHLASGGSFVKNNRQDYTPRILFETHTERVCSDVEIAPLVLVNDMSKLCDGVLKN